MDSPDSARQMGLLLLHLGFQLVDVGKLRLLHIHILLLQLQVTGCQLFQLLLHAPEAKLGFTQLFRIERLGK